MALKLFKGFTAHYCGKMPAFLCDHNEKCARRFEGDLTLRDTKRENQGTNNGL
tara:strand:- start:7814 stop:7972 length:159 start_codon:yes stop_codon:yes gene_type:complete